MPDAYCAYARNSDRHQETSIEQQIEEFRKFVALNRLTLYEPVFCDRSKSGTTDTGRTGIDALMEFLERRPRPVKGVLLWASSRLARNVDDSAFYKASIRRGGYRIIYLGDELLNSDGPERHVFESLYEFKDAKYSLDLARDVKRGMMSSASQGHAIALPPRGYKLVGQKLEIDPELEDRIHTAWDMRAAGFTLSDIHEATALYRSPAGYVNMFSNKTYTGTLVFGGMEFQNFCPPLCTPDQWARVQVVGSHALEHPRRARSSFLLSGRVFCTCGRAMVGQTLHHKAVYRYYACRRSKFNPDACGKSRIRADKLESAVTDQALAEFTAEKIGPVYAAWKSEHKPDAGHERTSLLRKLADCKIAIANLMRAVESGAYSTAISLQISAREQELEELENKVKALPVVPVTIDIPTLCQDMARMLRSDNAAEKRLALRTMVERVDVDGKDANIVIRKLPL